MNDAGKVLYEIWIAKMAEDAKLDIETIEMWRDLNEFEKQIWNKIAEDFGEWSIQNG